MKIELMDIDVPYEIADDITADGTSVIKIRPLSANLDRDEDYDIVLDYDMCQTLIHALQFISNEIKPIEQ